MRSFDRSANPRAATRPSEPPVALGRLNLRLGALLLVLWLIATGLVIALRLPWIVEKLALGVCAGLWALHVIRVAALARR